MIIEKTRLKDLDWKVYTATLCIIIQLIVTILNDNFPSNFWCFLKYTYVAFSTLYVFICGVTSHKKHSEALSNLKDKLCTVHKAEMDILKAHSIDLRDILGILKSSNDNFTSVKVAKIDAYVKLVLYAMYKSSKTPVSYKVIDPDNSEFVLVIINIIFSCYDSNTVSGKVTPTGQIDIINFEKDYTQTTTDGRELKKKYKAYGEINTFVNDAVARINAPCKPC